MQAETRRGRRAAKETRQNSSQGLALGALNPSGTPTDFSIGRPGGVGFTPSKHDDHGTEKVDLRLYS